MNLSLLLLCLCVFGVLSTEQQDIGRLSKHLLSKRNHQPLDVINGNRTSVTKYPFIASVLLIGLFQGPAVILNERWLLTTASTVILAQYPKGYLIRVGTNLFYQGGQYLYGEKIVHHPNFTDSSWDYNIALVKTAGKIKLNKKVQPIKLATKEPKAGTKAVVLGWGQYAPVSGPSSHLREGQVTVSDWDECRNVYANNITTKFVCTFDKHVGPCIDDWGDPLLVDNTLYGLFAGSFDCTPGYYPALYTDVALYYNWIKQTIKSDPDSSDLVV